MMEESDKLSKRYQFPLLVSFREFFTKLWVRKVKGKVNAKNNEKYA